MHLLLKHKLSKHSFKVIRLFQQSCVPQGLEAALLKPVARLVCCLDCAGAEAGLTAAVSGKACSGENEHVHLQILVQIALTGFTLDCQRQMSAQPLCGSCKVKMLVMVKW